MFKKAQRKQAKLKLAVTGPSGSGKTYSALRLAAGLGGKVALIDTENGSASLYSDKFAFDVLDLQPPFTVERYVEAINAAVSAGYTTLVIDSLSHAWAGEGGLLEQKEQLDARAKGSSYTNWASITKKHESLKSSILQSNVHIIATMRSKQDYVLVDKNGKQVPQKVGMAPVQRDGMEYEFTIVFDVAMNHEAEASKDRTGLFTDKIFKVSEDTGKQLSAWLEGGALSEVNTTSSKTPTLDSAPTLGEVVVPIGSLKGKKLKDVDADTLKNFLAKTKTYLEQLPEKPESLVKFYVDGHEYYAQLCLNES